MQIAYLTVTEALESLGSSLRGLDEAEARRRLASFGPNVVAEERGPSLPRRLLSELTHFFALILWIGAALAFFAGLHDPGGGMIELGVAIVVVVVVNGLFSFVQEYRAERALSALRSLLPPRCEVVRGGALVSVAADALVPGDVVIVDEGVRVPADCRVVESVGLRVDTATISGESVPRRRTAEPSTDTSPLSATNLLLAGTSVVSGHGKAVVFATGMKTEFGRIAHLTQTAGDTPSPLTREIEGLSRLVAVLAAALGVVFFLVGRAAGLPLWDGLLFGIGVIVANVPEGLLPTVTLSLAMATQRMAKRNALVRHLPAVEALGSTTVICCDKTGTLTRNRMSVRKLHVDGATLGAEAVVAVRERSTALVSALVTARVCHDLRVLEDGSFRGDPMESALADLAVDAGVGAELGTRVDELPFDTDRRRMSVVHQTERGRVVHCKGALESLLSVAASVAEHGEVRPLDEATKMRFLEAESEMAENGLRVLATGLRELGEGEEPSEQGLVLTGLFGLEDPPRPEVPAAVARCRDAGIRVLMVTGDHPRTAVAIGREVGLVRGPSPRVIHGDDLARMSHAELRLALEAEELVFARVTADQKMRVVEGLRARGEVVAVTGDGVNDAPALKTADVGIAMGIAGTDVAKAAADVVLLDDCFASIVHAIEEGRSVYEAIRRFLTYILTSNVPELVPYLCFVLFGIPLPLTVIQILAVDLGTDMLPALALGADPPDEAVMQRPPRARKERLLHRPLLLRAYLFLGPLEALASMVAYGSVLLAAGYRFGAPLARTAPLYLEATTACLAGIVVAQVVNVFLCRDAHRSAFSTLARPNRLLYVGIAFELALILVIVYTPFGHRFFGTAPLSPRTWALAATFALGFGLLEESRKAAMRAFARRSASGAGTAVVASPP